MTTTMQTNGQVRKSLSEQIDRLDSILDGLADGLNEAVVGAVKEAVSRAVKEAVQAVLTEVLSNPDFLGLLRGTLAPSTASTVEPASAGGTQPRRDGPLKRAWKWTWGKVRRVGQGLVTLVGKMRAVRRFKVELVTALGAGALAGLAAYYTGPWLSATVSGLGAFAATLGVHAGLWLRRMVGPLAASGA